MEKLGLGDMLREARNARGLTLSEVERETRIRQDYLQAMESEDLSSLPAPVYARGLLRVYAEYLRVDAREVTAMLDAQHVLESVPMVVREIPRTAAGPWITPRMLAALLAIIIVTGSAYYLYSQVEAFMASAALVASPTASPPAAPVVTASTPVSEDEIQVTPVIGAEPSIIAPSPTVAPPPTQVPTPIPPTPTPLREVTIEAAFTGRVWVHTEVDDQLVHTGVLLAGDRRVWVGQQKVFLWVGNAGFVDITYNGRPQGLLGAPGEVVKTTWTVSSYEPKPTPTPEPEPTPTSTPEPEPTPTHTPAPEPEPAPDPESQETVDPSDPPPDEGPPPSEPAPSDGPPAEQGAQEGEPAQQ